MAIPWLTLIKHAPTILSLSREVVQRTRQSRPASAGGTEGQLVADLHRQAELLNALAEQVQGLTAALAALRRALIGALVLGGAAFLLAAAALVLVLAR